MKKTVLAVTGIRSEYHILYPVLDALRNDERFDLKVVVCGAHLSDWHGSSVDRIAEDGFEIVDKIDYLLSTNRKVQRAKGVGLLTVGLTQTVERINPDFMLIAGDREECIAAGIVANYMDQPLAFIGGGDPVFGNADDPMRFATAKLAHIHFCYAKQHAQNLINIGEEEFRVFHTGNPSLDHIKTMPEISMQEISEYLKCDLEKRRYIVFLKHPLSSEKEDAYSQMKSTLECVKSFCQKHNYTAIGIYPNTDPGSYDILNVIEEYSKEDNIHFYKNLPRNVFVNLIRNTSALIGNSSMGILEAPFYKLPVINVGNRQLGRLNAGNVEFVGYGSDEITKALEKACFDAEYRESMNNISDIYGDGSTAAKIADILAGIDLEDKKWVVKRRLC